MSVANCLASGNALSGGRGPHSVPELLGVMTLTGAATMTAQWRNVLKLDPGGASRNVLLPPEEEGMVYLFLNAADAAENLVIKDDSNVTTVVTINQNEGALVYCTGGAWVLVCVMTIALS